MMHNYHVPKGWPGVFWDEQGRVVGFWGLAIPEMDHRFHAENGKPMYAWCALDPFLIVPVIGRQARVASKDPVTGEPIGKSERNLKSAVAGETYEYTQMYPGYGLPIEE